MASQNNLLSRIAALVAGFDDASWEALASKGLLRRARKDMEKGISIEIGEERPGTLQIKLPPFVVSMPESGPAKASCTCPAPGICQHIVAAGLYLQTQSLAPSRKPALATADSIREEINYFTPERLKTWAGSSDYRAGLLLLERNTLPPSIEYGETVLVRLMPSSLEARFLPGGGLDAMILPKAQGKPVAVAVLLALRKSFGLDASEIGVQQSLIEMTGSPRTPKEILASAAAVLEDAVKVGLSHASPVLVERLQTLAVSAQGANLPRVSLSLKTVADEVGSIFERDARADEGRLLLLMARVYALLKAISSGGETPKIELAGVPRAVYVEVPEIELFGVGAYTWKTGSGYEGLTVLFWSDQSKEFLSWAAARPGTQQFDPRQRFSAEGPWDGAQSPRQVACSHLKLRNARRTANGRLSGSTKTTALVLEATAPQTLDFGKRLFTSWDDLQRYARGRQPIGLREPNPLELVVVLEPAAFRARQFDSISQTFSWEVYDQADQPLTMSLPFRNWNKEAIQALEALAPPEHSRWRILARLALRDGLLWVEPVSILRLEDSRTSVFHLSFDTLPESPGPKGSPVSTPADEDEEDDCLEMEESTTEEAGPRGQVYLSKLLSELNLRLQATAEMGCQADRSNKEWFAGAYREIHGAGLTCLANAIRALGSSSPIVPGELFRARYICSLHSQCAGILL